MSGAGITRLRRRDDREDTGIVHQIANPATPDGTGNLVYLAIGAEPRGEVGTYPDSGAVVIDALDRRGSLREADYCEGQPQPTPLLTSGRDAPV